MGKSEQIVTCNTQVKKELPCLSNVVLIGDRRKFLSCLVTLKAEVRNRISTKIINECCPQIDNDSLEPKSKLVMCNVMKQGRMLQWCLDLDIM